MNAKKLLAVKIAGLAVAVLLVAAGLLTLPGNAAWRQRRDARAAKYLAPPYEPDLGPKYRHFMEYIDAMEGCPTMPRAVQMRKRRLGESHHPEISWRVCESRLRQGKPYNPFGIAPDARGWPRDNGAYVVFLHWRDRLSPAARAEYVRRCLAGAADEWLRSEEHGGGTNPHWALGYLAAAYNASDSARQREEIANRFYTGRLLYRANWVRNNGPARGALKPDEFVLVDWDLLRAGRGEAAVVPDPLSAGQPGTR